MTGFQPERQTVRLRNATVSAVTSPTVTITVGNSTVASIPVYGPMPTVGARVLVLEQGFSMLVLGKAVSLEKQVAELTARIDRLEASDGDNP
jgi:hypothetical protein